MRVERVTVTKYSGPATRARSATTEWPTRSGLLLTVRTPDARIGLGEASPLPGYSPDSLEDAASCLETIDWTALPEPDPVGGPSEELERLKRVGDCAGVPSARFALETAYLDVAGQRANRPIWSLLAEDARTRGPVPISSLVGSADDSDVVDRARSAALRGASAVKLKVSGPLSVERVARISRVREAIGRVPLRLDANQSLAPESAERELGQLAETGIEFVEEPVPSAALALLEKSAVRLALDETLQDLRNWSALEPHLERLGCVALVLKPMALGGLSACLDWVERARPHRLHVTVSHLFDGPVALTAGAHLALAVGSRRYASGLDTHGGLGAWPEASLPLHSANAIVPRDLLGLGLFIAGGDVR